MSACIQHGKRKRYLVEQLWVAAWVPERKLQILHDPEDSVALLQANHASHIRNLQQMYTFKCQFVKLTAEEYPTDDGK